MTTTQWQLLPVFLQVALIAYLGLRLSSGRVGSARSGETRMKDVALDNSRWPDRLRQIGNNFDNQFQLPTIWYAGIAFLLITGLADGVSIILSWLFMVSRLMHSAIHTGSNVVVRRFYAFVAGFICVLAIWIWFGVRLFITG
jgi:hypothetical protein